MLFVFVCLRQVQLLTNFNKEKMGASTSAENPASVIMLGLDGAGR